MARTTEGFIGAFIGSSAAIFAIYITLILSTGGMITIEQNYKPEYDALQAEYDSLQEEFDEYKERNTPVCEFDCGSTGMLYFTMGIVMYLLGLSTLFFKDTISSWWNSRKEE